MGEGHPTETVAAAVFLDVVGDEPRPIIRAGEVDRGEENAKRALGISRGLVPRLRASFPILDIEQIEDAVSEALVDLCRTKACAQTSEMAAQLYKAAWRNVRDTCRSERSRVRREYDWWTYVNCDITTPHDHTEVEEALRRILGALPDDRMKVVFRLRAAGERRTQVYAAALGFEEKDPRRLRAQVKREKDRLDKYLRRTPEIRAIMAEVIHHYYDLVARLSPRLFGFPPGTEVGLRIRLKLDRRLNHGGVSVADDRSDCCRRLPGQPSFKEEKDVEARPSSGDRAGGHGRTAGKCDRPHLLAWARETGLLQLDLQCL